MKIIYLLLFILPLSVFAQRNLPFDSLNLKDADDLFADDYGNIYLYKNKDFSFTKYDSTGNQKGKLMLTLPFKIQSVQNPLNIPSYSENAQELKFYDQNLNEIQTVNFRQKFGFIKIVYAEDLQQIWLLEESKKLLIQYNFRDDRIISSYPFNIDFENITDFIVFDNQVFLLTKTHFSVFNFKSEQIVNIPLVDGKRLRRENQELLIIGNNKIRILQKELLHQQFLVSQSRIVDKNSSSNFVIKDNKLYLYPIRIEK